MFIFAMIVGLLAIFCSHFGYTLQYIVVVCVALASDILFKRLSGLNIYGVPMVVKNNPINKEQKEKELTDAFNKVISKVSKEFENKALDYDYLSKNQIPIKINNDTGAYVVAVEDVINAIDTYMEKLGRYDDNGGNSNVL